MRFLILLLLTGLAQGQTTLMEDGLKALEAEKYDAALELFTKAVAEDPQDYAAHFNRAMALSFESKDAEAVSEYTKTLELKPHLYQAEMNLGILLLRSHQAAAAIPHLENASLQKPDQFRPVYYLGEAALEAQQFPSAQKAFEKAVQLEPKSAPAESGLGKALARQMHLEEAGPHYARAAELDPSYKSSLADLAAQYEAAGRPSDAIAIYKQFPESPAAEERVGVLLLSTGKPEEALEPLVASVQRSPSPANQLALAQAYVALKQPAKAEPLVSKALAASPEDFELRMYYGRLLRDQRKFNLAAPQFLTAAQASPKSVEAWSELAGVLVLLEQYPEALEALNRVHGLNAEAAGHFFLRGMVLDHLHQPKDAIANYNQFLAMSQGKNPDQEFQARQRVKTLELEVKRR